MDLREDRKIGGQGKVRGRLSENSLRWRKFQPRWYKRKEKGWSLRRKRGKVTILETLRRQVASLKLGRMRGKKHKRTT